MNEKFCNFVNEYKKFKFIYKTFDLKSYYEKNK